MKIRVGSRTIQVGIRYSQKSSLHIVQTHNPDTNKTEPKPIYEMTPTTQVMLTISEEGKPDFNMGAEIFLHHKDKFCRREARKLVLMKLFKIDSAKNLGSDHFLNKNERASLMAFVCPHLAGKVGWYSGVKMVREKTEAQQN